MLQKINNVFQIRFQIINVLGQQVMTAAPVCQIIRNDTNIYWNGFAWQSSPINLALTHFDGGLYTKDYVPTEVGTYTIKCDDYIYDNHITFQLEVYDNSNIVLIGIKGIDFVLKFSVVDAGGNTVSGASPAISIQSDATSLYWTGVDWSSLLVSLPMTEFYNGLYTYVFSSEDVGSYSIVCNEDVNNVHAAYSLNVLDSSLLNGQPIAVSSETILGPDGGASDVVDEFGSVISGATITAYNTDDSTSIKIVSFTDGTWSMYLKPGKYIFLFEKEGYVSVSFERVVM